MQYEVMNINNPLYVDSISKRLAEIVTGDFNDQVTVLINGNRGSGKSMLLLELGVKTAQEIAKIKGGNPSKYFNLDHVAIIRLNQVLDVIEHIEQFGIYGLDDIGVGYSNREWRSEKNIRMNKVLQTFRTDNVVTLLSVPDKAMIDKVPRELIDKYIETSKENNMYRLGLNFVKVFNIERLLREGSMLEILPLVAHMDGLHKYAKYVARKPPKEIVDKYEPLRKKIAAELRVEEAQAIKNGEIEVRKIKEPKKKITQKNRILELRRDYRANVDNCQAKYIDNGKGIPKAYWEANGINPYYARDVK